MRYPFDLNLARLPIRHWVRKYGVLSTEFRYPSAMSRILDRSFRQDEVSTLLRNSRIARRPPRASRAVSQATEQANRKTMACRTPCMSATLHRTR
ncbi:hypothetical protein EVAR_14050_1 [Eumeta japonica]|uniref:Uncharacterized protein n=1 Tax=Eumeta variegata TaxID=151549 RepID=A0A4C1UPG1_EUMVA|nr:hypothetical protein EVAR_14050_1 [Eumeta japonica]